VQEPLDRTHAEGADCQSLDGIWAERLLGLRRLDLLTQAACEQEDDGIVQAPPQGKGDRACRGAVQPLDVVDGDEKPRV
jgi:hypothetical protein